MFVKKTLISRSLGRFHSLASVSSVCRPRGTDRVSDGRKFPKHEGTHYRFRGVTTQIPTLHLFTEGSSTIDPFQVSKADILDLYKRIRDELDCEHEELGLISQYYFDGQGKALRPVVACLISRAANFHIKNATELLDSQKTLSLISEMIHTASLLHDDVIDISDKRRGKPTTGTIWGQRKSVFAGDYVLSKSAAMLANIGCVRCNNFMSQILVDLVSGEFMQMEVSDNFNDRITNYVEKSFRKTASLLAFTCKSAVSLAGANDAMMESAFQYGKNIGIAFQLIDDILDFVSDENRLGKPAAADLKLGLSTGPVLFACEEYPELHELIQRRFTMKGDVERAHDFVMKSDGLAKTKHLAEIYSTTAARSIEDWQESVHKQALLALTDRILQRKK